MARTYSDVSSLYFNKSIVLKGEAYKNIVKFGTVIEQALDNAFTKLQAQEYTDHYEVVLTYPAEQLPLSFPDATNELQQYVSMKYILAGWDKVVMDVSPVSELGRPTNYQFKCQIFKPVKPWQPSPNMDFSLIRRFGGSINKSP